MPTVAVLWWSARHNAKRIPCKSVEEARGLVQHIQARGPYRARIDAK